MFAGHKAEWTLATAAAIEEFAMHKSVIGLGMAKVLTFKLGGAELGVSVMQAKLCWTPKLRHTAQYSISYLVQDLTNFQFVLCYCILASLTCMAFCTSNTERASL